MRIQILGMGCAKCQKLEERTRKAVDELKLGSGILYDPEVVTACFKLLDSDQYVLAS